MNPYFLMCDDLERAAQNREIISKKLYIWAYLQIEAWLAGNPTSELPYWIYSEGFIDDKSKKKKSAGKMGGLSRANKLTAKRRHMIARKAAKKRWMLSKRV